MDGMDIIQHNVFDVRSININSYQQSIDAWFLVEQLIETMSNIEMRITFYTCNSSNI